MPRKKTRNKKGTVAIRTKSGMLRLRWTYQGKRYELCTGLPDSPLSRQSAKGKAAEIESDIYFQRFDETLNKYRDKPQFEEVAQQVPTAELFEQFIESRRAAGTGEYNLTQVYGAMLRYLQRFGADIDNSDRALEFIGKIKMGELRATAAKPISDRTLNKYLSMLRRFSRWAIANDHWDVDPFRKCEPIRTERNRASRAAFSDEERDRLLTSIRFHKHYSNYHGFISALFFLGFRPSELIGLQWKHVDLEGHNITIAQSLSRGWDGKTASYARQRKGTKAGTIRTLPLNNAQVQLLTRQWSPNLQPDVLVFPSPTGRAIDDSNFCGRVWRAVLISAQVMPYRPPYTARHTFATWAKRNGMTDEQLAYWMGHKTTRMVREHYGHLDENPLVPEFDIAVDEPRLTAPNQPPILVSQQ